MENKSFILNKLKRVKTFLRENINNRNTLIFQGEKQIAEFLLTIQMNCMLP